MIKIIMIKIILRFLCGICIGAMLSCKKDNDFNGMVYYGLLSIIGLVLTQG